MVSAHDVSEGGLAITLLESAFNNNLGFEVTSNGTALRSDAFWFGESQSRVLVSVTMAHDIAFKNSLQSAGIPFTLLGKVTSQQIMVEGKEWGTSADWKSKYDNAIGDILKRRESETSLSAI